MRQAQSAFCLFRCSWKSSIPSLFTSVLPADDIMDLLNLCLTSTYFQYNGKHYKQLHGTAMGSPVSVVVAEIVMQNIEEQALATYTRTVRYVAQLYLENSIQTLLNFFWVDPKKN